MTRLRSRLLWSVVWAVQPARLWLPRGSLARRALWRIEVWAYEHILAAADGNCRGFWWVPPDGDLVDPGTWPKLDALVSKQPPRNSWRDEPPEPEPFL